MRLRVFVLVLLCLGGAVWARQGSVAVTGTLIRSMGIGGESTGWALQLDSPVTFDGRDRDTIEVTYDPVSRLSQLASTRVKAGGAISSRAGVETGSRPVLVLSSIEPLSPSGASAGVSGDLVGREWVLKDLNGRGLLDKVEATLTIAKDGKVSGNASCNRFFGSATIHESSITFGPLGSTRMSCQEAVNQQETQYLSALASARTFRVSDSQLLLFCDGLDQPLRFVVKEGAKTADAGSLVNRVWQISSVASDSSRQAAPGSFYVFLSSGLLLEGSCVETYRIARWRADGEAPSRVIVTEDDRPAFTATVSALPEGGLRMRQSLVRSGEEREIVMREVVGEFVCSERGR